MSATLHSTEGAPFGYIVDFEWGDANGRVNLHRHPDAEKGRVVPVYRAAPSGWQPIETAPKHTEVLVWRDDSGTFIAKLTTPDAVITPDEMEREGLEFPDDFEEWFSDAYGWQEGSERPTLWMPLPTPPAPNQGEAS